ncbi:hypothetical protein HPB48_015128 [Haemaphysalis longicornis]|uniref:Sulfatase N-terminal domain-containing protein n=1 Tax=Haemaphysalis longicornis TaxID=44386 RepID=A0A9J6G4F0_HAELO|nr:hypothetical protein HPB48_015128 [Haemaphysalis longicornis]
MVDAMDQSVGVVVEALYEAQMLDNTIVVFLSDNGGQPWGPHASRSFNWPLRGTKATLWEGGTRAAAFLWSPLVAKRRRVSQQLMHITDWLPTLYSAAGGKPGRLSRQAGGREMWHALSSDKSSPRTEILYNYDVTDGTAALRYGSYKLVQAGLYRWNSLQFPKTGVSRATVRCPESGSRPSNFVSGKPPYLFDLDKDPCELKNLASSLPKVVASLQKRLDRYISAAVPPGNQPVDPRGYPDNNNGIWAPWL